MAFVLSLLFLDYKYFRPNSIIGNWVTEYYDDISRFEKSFQVEKKFWKYTHEGIELSYYLKDRIATKVKCILFRNCQIDSEQLVNRKVYTSAKKNQECHHNFASSSSGAVLLESPKGATGSGNILKNGKDEYVIIPCSAKKEFVISLSEDTVIEKFQLLSQEEFSSKIEQFDLYGSDTYNSEEPKWEKLGSFIANNEFNGIWQSFKIKKAWIRYIKFEWKTSFGPYTFCTLTQLKVCGRTMVQGLTEDLKSMDLLKEEETPKEDLKDKHPVKTTEFKPLKYIFDDNITQTIIEDIFLFRQPESEFLNLKPGICEVGSILHYLNEKCPPMNNCGVSGVPATIYNPNNDKLSEIFARIFQNLDYKIRQLGNKTTQMFTDLRIEAYHSKQDIKKYCNILKDQKDEHLQFQLEEFKQKLLKQDEMLSKLQSLLYYLIIAIAVMFVLFFGTIILQPCSKAKVPPQPKRSHKKKDNNYAKASPKIPLILEKNIIPEESKSAENDKSPDHFMTPRHRKSILKINKRRKLKKTKTISERFHAGNLKYMQYIE
ncbi:unnamed protein product [Moneuplotes crassus]|uniref:SUN domain-containing protein n=1 Tax=Euplotes crassus TaxID=5936 RepID=A0AAD1XA58_EUPCR|nr:unnamed protein product [Moneuplotes crassus]